MNNTIAKGVSTGQWEEVTPRVETVRQIGVVMLHRTLVSLNVVLPHGPQDLERL